MLKNVLSMNNDFTVSQFAVMKLEGNEVAISAKLPDFVIAALKVATEVTVHFNSREIVISFGQTGCSFKDIDPHIVSAFENQDRMLLMDASTPTLDVYQIKL